MKIYTRTGDRGDTGLFGGNRVSKAHARIEAYGAVDETNALLGMARAFASEHPASERLDSLLAALQDDLFVAGSDLATPLDSKAAVPRLAAAHIERLEKEIDCLEEDLTPLENFILPGGIPIASILHVARTTCRRAERRTVAATAAGETFNEAALKYLNRLSDYLFVLARWANSAAGGEEHVWKPK